MYTRLVIFNGAEDLDAGIAYLKNTAVPLIRQQKGYRGISAQVDRVGGHFTVLTRWETEADRDASESAVGKTRQEALELVGGDMMVEYLEELAFDETSAMVPGSGLSVRRFSVEPRNVEKSVEFFKTQALPRIKALSGYLGSRLLINRATGEALVVTAWKDLDTAKTASQQNEDTRAEATRTIGVSFRDPLFREVVFSETA